MPRSKMRKLLPILLMFLLAACGGTRREGDFGGGGKITKVQVLARALDAQREINDGAIAYDLRDYGDWAQGHLPGARSATLEDLKLGRGLPDDKDAPVMFYGDGALDQSAEDAAEIAVAAGYRKVLYFPGGWRAWSGQPAVD
ncbi:MAG: rhodanese-like domain-containing protein [Planctomycetes bacterium]|nr:rhodanese-like domain-containing protein [Planctomycetota bacterium]